MVRRAIAEQSPKMICDGFGDLRRIFKEKAGYD
jgi:hypothetical protein